MKLASGMSGDNHILIGACLGASVNSRRPEPIQSTVLACHSRVRLASHLVERRPEGTRTTAYHRATVHSVALWCIAVEKPRRVRLRRAPAPCVSGSSRNLRSFESAATWTTLSCMDQNLYRRLMPRPKVGRSRPTTAAATPAAFHLVHLQVLGREQMAFAADVGYRHGFEDTF